MHSDDAIARLARQIDATRRSERLSMNSSVVAGLRRQGACELHRICAEFVDSVNRALADAMLELSPAQYTPEMFQATGTNLIQISSQGRQMQISFLAGPQLVSTEKFLVPYILEGEVRTYNQKMLEHLEIRNQLLFYCIEDDQASWRFYDWRSARTGPVNRDFLVSLMEALF
jgi:hypothetical protein